MGRYHLIDIVITIVMVLSIVGTIDALIFQTSYIDRVGVWECDRLGGEIISSDIRDCCGNYCFYHAGPDDSQLAQLWNRTVSPAMTVILYPFIRIISY